MLKNRPLSVAAIVAVLGAFAAYAQVDAADAPKVSTFAPAEDLARQADKFIESMKNTVASEEEYKDSEGKIGRDSNTLIVIALAMGLHDQESKYKARAGALMKAAQDVAATKDYASAKKAVAALEKVVGAEGNAGPELRWEKVASLPDLMKQVPLIHTKLKLCVKGANFKKKAADSAGYSAVIAAIAQGSIADTSATKNIDQVKLWRKFSTAMRDDAGAVNAAIHKGDAPATAKAMKKLNQSCEDCHDVFKPKEK
jgi:cytochrome c556